MKEESKEHVRQSIEELISMFRLLKIKVESLPDDSELLPYIAFTLTMGKKAASTLHKKFMIDQMKKDEPESLKKNLKSGSSLSRIHSPTYVKSR